MLVLEAFPDQLLTREHGQLSQEVRVYLPVSLLQGCSTDCYVLNAEPKG